jgi:hypothetical protein
MAVKTFHIELRCPGVSDPRKIEAIKELVRINARNLFGGTVLVMGNETPPAIACYSEDFLQGQEEILTDTQEGDDD